MSDGGNLNTGPPPVNPPVVGSGEPLRHRFIRGSLVNWTVKKIQHDGIGLEILYCDPKGRRALLRTPSTEGRSVCLCWAPSKPKGPKGAVRSRTAPVTSATRKGGEVTRLGWYLWHEPGSLPVVYLVTQVGNWGTRSDNVGLIQSTKAPLE